MEKRTVPIKNYIIFGFVVILTVLVTFYMTDWYNMTKYYFLDYSSMSETVPTIEIEGLPSYFQEREDVIIYIASSKDKNIKTFENKFRKLLINEEIVSEVIYIDTSKVAPNFYEKFVTEFYDQTLVNRGIYLNIIPNILYVYQGKVTTILYEKESDIKIDDAKKFLIDNGVIYND